jgi:hypothetical protein
MANGFSTSVSTTRHGVRELGTAESRGPRAQMMERLVSRPALELVPRRRSQRSDRAAPLPTGRARPRAPPKTSLCRRGRTAHSASRYAHHQGSCRDGAGVAPKPAEAG